MTDYKFERGDQAEMANVAICDLSEDSPAPLACDFDTLWKCNEYNIWRELHKDVVINKLRSYAGKPVFAGFDKNDEVKTKPLKVNSYQTALQFVESAPCGWGYGEGFFEGAAVGVPFLDTFVRIEDQRIITEALKPEHRAMWSLPFEYEPTARGEKWEAYLESVFEGEPQAQVKIDTLQEFVGGALFGLSGKYQQALMLLGEGSNGKSVFLQVVSALVPDEAQAAVSPNQMGHEYHRAALAGKRLNVVTELSTEEPIVPDALKALITCEPIGARHPAGRAFTLRSNAAHMFSANGLPPVRDQSRGFWRRWLIVGFNREFTEGEIIRGLAEQIIEDELGAVAIWAIEGAKRLVKQKCYSLGSVGDSMIDLWRIETDTVAAFIYHECEVDVKNESNEYVYTQSSVLFKRYTDWAKDNNHLPVSSTKFGKRMKPLVKRDDKHNFLGGPRGVRAYRCKLKQQGLF